MFTFKTKYGEYKDCYFNFTGKGSNTRIDVISQEEGPVVTINSIINEVDLKEDEILIKDYAENEGVLLACLDLGVIELTGLGVRTNYATFPIVKYNKDHMLKLSN